MQTRKDGAFSKFLVALLRIILVNQRYIQEKVEELEGYVSRSYEYWGAALLFSTETWLTLYEVNGVFLLIQADRTNFWKKLVGKEFVYA